MKQTKRESSRTYKTKVALGGMRPGNPLLRHDEPLSAGRSCTVVFPARNSYVLHGIIGGDVELRWWLTGHRKHSR